MINFIKSIFWKFTSDRMTFAFTGAAGASENLFVTIMFLIAAFIFGYFWANKEMILYAAPFIANFDRFWFFMSTSITKLENYHF